MIAAALLLAAAALAGQDTAGLVEAPGFREVAKHVEVRAGEPAVLDVVLQIANCPPGPCRTVEPWDSAVMLSVPRGESGWLALRNADLNSFKRETVLFHDAATNAAESYSGFSLAGVLEKFSDLGGISGKYAVLSGNADFIVVPLTQLLNRASGGVNMVIADSLAGTRLPNNQLRAFLIENGRVVESARGVIGVRLTSPR